MVAYGERQAPAGLVGRAGRGEAPRGVSCRSGHAREYRDALSLGVPGCPAGRPLLTRTCAGGGKAGGARPAIGPAGTSWQATWVSRRGRPWWAPGASLGDWEGDTLGRRSPIVTHVERKSRYLLAGKLADRTAATFAVGSVTLFQPLPVALRRTLTLDNGSECARFSVIAAHTGLAVYFAAPYAAWQRGTNETTNGLLRQSFPKGTDFRRVTARALPPGRGPA